jgi:MFS family permease
VLSSVGHVVGRAIRGTHMVARGSLRGGRWVGRRVGRVKERGAAGEAGMMRLFDLHAASCAGDTLITIGLAGTIFFSAPIGEARSGVALYLLVTMIPFALLAPIVGPLLDHFRHGRRYALAATMLGRAFLAWLISDYIGNFGLYPAAFGVLALSRAYGVARSAAVPRLLPARLGLSEAGARASVYGTIAGAVVAPFGVIAFKVGPQWPLRLSSVIFIAGMVIALRLPPLADSDPPETVPHLVPFGWLRRNGREKALTGRLVTATVIGSGCLRALYGFLLLFLAFTIKAGDLPSRLLGMSVGDGAAIALVGGALGAGTFLSHAAGTRLRIRRPVALQAGGLIVVAVLAVIATLRFNLTTVALLCLAAAGASGLAKLAVDASIQEKIDERVRASAFAHAETVLMLAWVAGASVGLIPVAGRVGVGLAAGFASLAALRAVLVAGRLRRDQLRGRASRAQTAPATPSPPTRPPPRTTPPPGTTPPPPGVAAPRATRKPTEPASPISPAPSLAPPGYHIYRPTADPGQGESPDASEDGSRRGRGGPKG